MEQTSPSFGRSILYSPRGKKKKKDKLEGEDVVSLGRLVRLPACSPLQ